MLSLLITRGAIILASQSVDSVSSDLFLSLSDPLCPENSVVNLTRVQNLVITYSSLPDLLVSLSPTLKPSDLIVLQYLGLMSSLQDPMSSSKDEIISIPSDEVDEICDDNDSETTQMGAIIEDDDEM